MAKTSFPSKQTPTLLIGEMREIHTPNHELYEQYNLNQAKQIGRKPTYFPRCSLTKKIWIRFHFKTSFLLGNNTLKQGVKALREKKALKTGVSVAQGRYVSTRKP